MQDLQTTSFTFNILLYISSHVKITCNTYYNVNVIEIIVPFCSDNKTRGKDLCVFKTDTIVPVFNSWISSVAAGVQSNTYIGLSSKKQ